MARGPFHPSNAGVSLLPTLTDPNRDHSALIIPPPCPFYTQETTNAQRTDHYGCPGKYIAMAARRFSLAYMVWNWELIPGNNGSSI